jgi:hypothetical protein
MLKAAPVYGVNEMINQLASQLVTEACLTLKWFKKLRQVLLAKAEINSHPQIHKDTVLILLLLLLLSNKQKSGDSYTLPFGRF